MGKPRIRLIGTGGTISAVSEDRTLLAGYTVGGVSVDLQLEMLPEVEEFASVTAEQPFSLRSSDILGSNSLALVRLVSSRLADPDVDAVVVTSGTARLAETAYLHHLLIPSPKPLVFVGAMRPWSTLSSDGPLNLLNAIRAAASNQIIGSGATLVMNDEIHSARDARKGDSRRVHAFTSGSTGLLGVIDPDQVVVYRRPARRHTTGSEFAISAISDLPPVSVVPPFPYRGSLADHDASAPLVVADPAQDLFPSLAERAHGGGVVVVADTRGGRTHLTADLKAAGVVGADNLTLSKTILLLQIALASGIQSHSDLQRVFNEY